MTRRHDVGLLVASLVLAALAVMRWRNAVPLGAAQAPSVSATSPLPAPFDSDSLEAASDATTERDPFRLSRTPSTVPYSREAAGLPAAPAAPRFVPTLVLRGIVGGPPWQAVIDGIPGSPPGTVVRSGSTFEKLVIQSVLRDTVVVQTPDSTWHLTLSKRLP